MQAMSIKIKLGNRYVQSGAIVIVCCIKDTPEGDIKFLRSERISFQESFILSSTELSLVQVLLSIQEQRAAEMEREIEHEI